MWTLGLAPPVGVELHWEPSLGIGLGAYLGAVVVDMGALDPLMVSPLAKKRVMSGGNLGSPPSSSSVKADLPLQFLLN